MQGRPPPRVLRVKQRSIEPEDALSRLSYWLDSRFEIPGLGWRFGLDPIIGLIPGIGDLLSLLPSLLILLFAVRYGVPRITLIRMGINLALDFGIGALPVVGDLFDAWFKANQRNVALIQRTRVRGPHSRAVLLSDWLFVGTVCALVLALLVGAIALTWTVLASVLGRLLGGGAVLSS